MKKHHGLAKQFTALILLSGLCSALLLVGMQYALNKALRAYFSREEVQQRIAIEQLADLQTYIDENQLASTDWKEIDEWSHRHRNTMLGFYREGEEPYFSMP